MPNPPGKEIFEDRCGTCHGADGNGGEHAPTITRAAPDLQDSQLTTFIREVCRFASPMACQFDGQEYTAIAAGDDIISFGFIE